MPSDHRAHAVADPGHNGKPLGRRLHRFLVPVPKLEPPINPALQIWTCLHDQLSDGCEPKDDGHAHVEPSRWSEITFKGHLRF